MAAGSNESIDTDRTAYRHRSSIDHCPIYEYPFYETEMYCDQGGDWNEERLYRHSGMEYTGDKMCGGCDFFEGFVEQWRNEIVSFHELLHGSGEL